MPKLEMACQVMVQDHQSGLVLVQDRVKSWKGLAFPGGKVEEHESIVDAAIRELKEETGLDVWNLKSCGLVHWLNKKTFDRYFVFLFKISDYSGELMDKNEEDRNFWISIEEFHNVPSENQTRDYLPMFLEDKFSEAFGAWTDDEPYEFVYK